MNDATATLRRVLLVDDDPLVTTAMRRNLESRYEVVTAGSGSEAIARCEAEGPFPVVVSDFRMPGMDGIELLDRIRRTYPETIRVMLSGAVDMAATIRAVNEGGVQRLLLKPAEANAVEQMLDDAIAAYDRGAKERALAFVDPMLEIGTRRAFEQAALRTHTHAVRHNRTFAVVMVDVDNFKRYNDHCGHVAGDAVLCQIAKAIREAKRASDELFRFGGEEFVLILPDTDEHGAGVAIERYRLAIEELELPHELNESRRVTISLGAAISSPDNRGDFRSTIEQADQALYWAKRHGRNRAKVWDSSA